MPKLNWDDLIAEVREEWRRLWHNAHLDRVSWPTMSDYEADYLNDWINMMTPIWLDEIEALILDECGVLWSLATYGRSGATVAPGDLPSHGYAGDYGRELADGALNGEESWNRDLEGYNEDYATLRALCLLNAEVRARCKRLPGLWEAEKDALEIAFDEDED